jgi:putative oxidoreductase
MKGFFEPYFPIAILRILMGLIFMAHGIARLVDYSLPGFGEFLESKSFPAGFYLAWAITIFEITGGLLMVFRKFVPLFCVVEILILLTGIVIVHAQNGWFVVGKTLGGIEYSVVLITVLSAIFISETKNVNIKPVL